MTAIANESVAAVSPLAAGAAAIRKFWRPFLLIQSAAVLLVLAYHFSQSVRAACEVVGVWKTSGGLPFAACSAAIAGGLLLIVGLGPGPFAIDNLASRRRGRVFSHA